MILQYHHLVIFLVCNLSYLKVCHAQSTIIDLDKNSSAFTKISEIATELKPITFKVDEEHSFGSIREILFLNHSIVLTVHEKFSNELVSKALQFDLEGNFIRQIGEKHTGFISLSYDPDRKEIGINDIMEINFFNEEGVYKRRIQTSQYQQIYYNGSYWLVEMETKEGKFSKYNLVRHDPFGNNKKIVWSYKNPPDMVAGMFPTYSFIAERLFFSTNLNSTIYSVENDRMKPLFEIKSVKPISSEIQYLSGWIFASSADPRRSGRILHFYNLRENKNYTARFYFKENSTNSTIKNDFLDNGLIRPFDGRVLGYPNQKAFCFINAFLNDSETSHTIYIAILK